MEIASENLRIIPLTLGHFELLLHSTHEMEQALHLSPGSHELDEHTKQAMEGLYQQALQSGQDYIWYTNWQIILKSANISIGSACFMGRPNERQEVEIGYGINEDFQNKGYITEAVRAICDWAFSQPTVTCIIAQTEKDNIPSHRVLQKCGMERYKETEEGLWWRLESSV